MSRSSLQLILMFWVLCRALQVQGASVDLVNSGWLQQTMWVAMLASISPLYEKGSEFLFHDRLEDQYDLSVDRSDEGYESHSILVCAVSCPAGGQGSSSKKNGSTGEGRQSGGDRTYADVVAGRYPAIACMGGDEPPDDRNNEDGSGPSDPSDETELECSICGEVCEDGLTTSCCGKRVCKDCAGQWNENRCIYCCSRHRARRYCGVNGCKTEVTGIGFDQLQSHLFNEHAQGITLFHPCCQQVVASDQMLPTDHALTHHSHSVITDLNQVSVACQLSYVWLLSVPAHQIQTVPANQPLPAGALAVQPVIGTVQVQQVQFICDLCQHVTLSSVDHSIHMSMHMMHLYSHGMLFICPHQNCQYQAASIVGLYQHLHDHHVLFTCPHFGCGASYRQERLCQAHFNRCHGKYVGGN
ncbi:hypothetical protein [Endozoicomonas arenosclerae]|uniref:hypothetical protein n=1 Tax=Endozoicomonas arenosclerae TaxID=1633495 RepID=UPI00078510A4|nr:hypothetical protein [Endozoicomonas arenosclerae]